MKPASTVTRCSLSERATVQHNVPNVPNVPMSPTSQKKTPPGKDARAA